ncbi:MAG: hypothetical protein ABIH18_03015 [Candidatus Omnitrophota bacterium]
MAFYRIIIVLTLLFVMPSPMTAYSQEAKDTASKDTEAKDTDSPTKISVIRGKVKEVNWVARKIVVKTHDFRQEDNITFIVPDTAKIIKGTNEITFGNINISSQVIVEFYPTSSGFKVIRITIQ